MFIGSQRTSILLICLACLLCFGTYNLKDVFRRSSPAFQGIPVDKNGVVDIENSKYRSVVNKAAHGGDVIDRLRDNSSSAHEEKKLGLKLVTHGRLGNNLYRNGPVVGSEDHHNVQIHKIGPGTTPDGIADYLKQIKTNQTMSFFYTGANNQTASRSLKLTPAQAKQLGWDEPIEYMKLTEENVKRFVFVTAANNIFYKPFLGFLETFLKFKPNHTVYFYDIGLTLAQIQKIKGMDSCGIIYRKFKFKNYPEHTKILKGYAWKILMIWEVLRHEPVVYWVDTSVRFYSGNFSRIYKTALRTDGIVSFAKANHPTFPVTHPDMYDFLPVDIGIAKDKREAQQAAGIMFYCRTKFVMERIMFWSVLCALNKGCVNPKGAKVICPSLQGNFTHAVCHRYDQSVLNILLLNEFKESGGAAVGDPGLLAVKRGKNPTVQFIGCVRNATIGA